MLTNFENCFFEPLPFGLFASKLGDRGAQSHNRKECEKEE
jgi:hypothetical protein